MNNDGICESDVPVSEEYIGAQDAVRRILLVEPEGASREYTVSEFVCVGSGMSSHWDIPKIYYIYIYI